MPRRSHTERHFTASLVVRDLVIGMSDGLTVPFALAAGLSGATDSTALIVTAGLAEIAAGSIAMGLGGYLAAKSDAEHYASEQRREQKEVAEIPEEEMEEVAQVFRGYGLTREQVAPVVNALSERPKAWVDFMMRFELGLEKPSPERARTSALTIGGAYMAGGMIPLSPYILISRAHIALLVSIVVTLLSLLVFGYIKGRFTTPRPIKSALETALVGSLAAGAAFLIAKAIS
ncbi:MAG TPA: VIT1/CCC1 transporter family protein [Blastocatellia bacterium]|nr:VIT1/CCC1 transporter family protein [Blastocatellia bacterium]